MNIILYTVTEQYKTTEDDDGIACIVSLIKYM